MARGDGSSASLRVAVACSPRAGTAFEIELDLAAPATAWDAVCASGVLERWPELVAGEPRIGIWGRAASPDVVLHDGDRVELYRPLTMNPQEARRLRARRAGARERR
jgi:hypothetical protein